jgi:hypothetical protein
MYMYICTSVTMICDAKEMHTYSLYISICFVSMYIYIYIYICQFLPLYVWVVCVSKHSASHYKEGVSEPIITIRTRK